MASEREVGGVRAVLAEMKIWTKGRHPWSRTIGSRLAGQGIDVYDQATDFTPFRARV